MTSPNFGRVMFRPTRPLPLTMGLDGSRAPCAPVWIRPRLSCGLILVYSVVKVTDYRDGTLAYTAELSLETQRRQRLHCH